MCQLPQQNLKEKQVRGTGGARFCLNILTRGRLITDIRINLKSTVLDDDAFVFVAKKKPCKNEKNPSVSEEMMAHELGKWKMGF